MVRSERHYGHVLRVAGLFALGFVGFVIVRQLLVPADFNLEGYGFFRAGALDEIAARPVAYAGQDTCAGCHSDVQDTKAGGGHAPLRCEGCHGPLARHADDPMEVKPPTLNPRRLCLTCHRQMAGKYEGFPQIDAQEHAGDDACTTCHDPHHPLDR
jgi:hypothetical protein